MDPRIGVVNDLLKRASEKLGDRKICNMRVNVDDEGTSHTRLLEYTCAYNKELVSKFPYIKNLTGPGHTCHSWPEANVTDFQMKIKEIISSSNTSPTIHKVGWFGNVYSAVATMPEKVTRPLMKEIGDSNPDIFDIINTQVGNKTFVPIEDMTKYSYLIDIGGQGYSGRLKYLMFTKRPLLYVERRFIEWFNDEMIPWMHYVPVASDLSDLVEKAQWLFDNPGKAREIAQSAFSFAMDHFTEDKLFERIQNVSYNYAQLSRFSRPNPSETS